MTEGTGEKFGTLRRFLASFLLLAAALTSGMLVLQHLSGLALPGCGPSSACAQLSASFWGSVAGWPVSYLGTAYFLGLSVAFLASGSRPLSRAPKILLLLGGLISLGFLAIMASEQKWCVYCLAAHFFHLAALGLLFWPQVSQTEAPVQKHNWWPVFVGTAVTATVLLAVIDWQTTTRIEARQRALTEQSIDQILSQLPAGSDDPGDPPPAEGGFTGRYQRGPEQAAVRLVVFHDYQCKDCAKLDAELEKLLEEQPLLSVSIRHYPLCSQCNPNIVWDFFHPQACQAAYLAEAAARLGGTETFWHMHRWLFEKQGVYQPEELENFCQTHGLDSARLLELASQPDIQQLVLSDISEANALGATGTPFVFLNGIEVQGTSSKPENARLAVERVLAENPTPRTSDWDKRPPQAEDRLLTEWLAAETVELPPAESARFVFGNPAGTKRILLFLEPTDRNAPSLWQKALQVSENNPNVRLELYLFPIHSQINPGFSRLKTEFYPHSPRLTRLLDAFGQAKPETQATAISWALNAPVELTDAELLTQAASQSGLEFDLLQELCSRAEIPETILADLKQAQAAQVSWAPTLIVRNRPAPTAAISQQVIERLLTTPASP